MSRQPFRATPDRATTRLRDRMIDTTNPIADAPPEGGVLRFFTTLDDSLMERLQRAAPEARFVKAFSCVGNGVAAVARAIEPLCILWCIPGFLENDWVRAYKVLRPAK